jgi:cytochrome b6
MPAETGTEAGGARPAESRVFRWLDERYHISDLIEFARHKTVPIHRGSVWYYFGGVSLFLFVIQVGTGILLMLYYKPGADTAHESIQFILTTVEFGWLVRAIHSWSANLLILTIFVHMFSVFFARSFQKPREFTWITGTLLLLVSLGFGFSGYLLPWNELAFFATKVGTDIMGAVPVLGKAMLALLRGGEDVTEATLYRFYGMHVAILPGIMTLIVGIHLLFVQRQGMSAPPDWEKREASLRKSMPFFPNFLLRDAWLWLIVLNVLAILAVAAPFGFGPFEWHLGEKADPFTPAPEGIRPEWYFMFMFQTLKLLPAHIGPFEGEVVGVVAFGVAGALFVLLPFWGRFWESGRGASARRWIGIVAVVYIVGMTIWGYVE